MTRTALRWWWRRSEDRCGRIVLALSSLGTSAPAPGSGNRAGGSECGHPPSDSIAPSSAPTHAGAGPIPLRAAHIRPRTPNTRAGAAAAAVTSGRWSQEEAKAKRDSISAKRYRQVAAARLGPDALWGELAATKGVGTSA